MNYIITNNRQFFDDLGDYNYCNLEDMVLPKVIAIDSETTALNNREGRMFAYQIGTGKNNYLIDMQDHNNGLDFQEVVPYLKDRVLVGQNIVFDLTFMYSQGFYPNRVLDTFLASKLLYNGKKTFRHDFGTIMERELNVKYVKDEQKTIHITQLRTARAIQYSFDDVDRLLELMNHLWSKIKVAGMELTANIHFEYIKGLAYMENCGMPFSTERWEAKLAQDTIDLKESTAEVVKYIYDTLPQFRYMQMDMFSDEIKILPKLSSNKQMLPVFGALEINTTTDKGKDSIGEDTIKMTPHPFVDIWLKFKSAQHSINNFGQSILDKVVDGRIYTSFNPILDTARISTRRGGINFLNFPANKQTRAGIKAKEGYSMIVADYDGQENITGADLHNDPMMLKAIDEGLDLHCAFAKMIFPELMELSDEEIKTTHKDKRSFSKAPRFCLAYGGSGYTIAMNQNLPVEEGNRLEGLFKELHSGVYEWGKEVYAAAIKVGYIESAGGFRLHLPFFEEFQLDQDKVDSLSRDFWQSYKAGKKEWLKKVEDEEKGIVVNTNKSYDEKLYLAWREKISKVAKRRSAYMRLCLNNPIQTTSAHQTKLALIYLMRHIMKRGHLDLVKVCNIPHDELVLEVLNELCDEYKEVLGDCMRRAGDFFLKSGLVKMGAEANVGEDWYEAK